MIDASAATVETPSRLLFFFKPSLSTGISAHLPTDVIRRKLGERITLGRSSSADIRLNDERMSRIYGEVWHDGKDPFVFKIRNVSDRKLLQVDNEALGKDDQTCIKDGCKIKFDFIEFLTKILPGDLVTECFEVSFIKNTNIRQGVSRVGSGECFDISQVSSVPPIVPPEQVNLELSAVAQTRDLLLHRQVSLTSNDLDSGCGIDTDGIYRPNIQPSLSCYGCGGMTNCLVEHTRQINRQRLACEHSETNDGSTENNELLP